MHNYNVDRKYLFNTRIGNWSEEWELDEYKMKEYLKKKEDQRLVCVDKEDKLKSSLARAELTYADEGVLKYGYRVQLQSDFMDAIISTIPSESIAGIDEAYAVAASQFKESVARNVFQIIRYEKDILHNDDLLRYGQNFRIAITNNPDKTLYLSSTAISPQKCAKFSRKQEVCLSVNNSINSVWCIEYSDPKLRYEMKGEPVRAGEPVLIKHVPTSQWLASDNILYNNEFGREFEVFCHSFTTHNKTQNLIAEKVGRKTIETPMRNQYNQNTFRIITAIDPSTQATAAQSVSGTATASGFTSTIRRGGASLTKTDLLHKVRRQLMNKSGPYALRYFGNQLASYDPQNTGVISSQSFKQAFQLLGLTLIELDIQDLEGHYKADGQNQLVNYVQLLEEIKGTLLGERGSLVDQAYTILSSKLGGNVTLNGVLSSFKKTKHPDVIKRYCTDKEAFNDFVLSWGKTNPHQQISKEIFKSYYTDFSACVDKDDYFEAVIKNVWDIPS